MSNNKSPDEMQRLQQEAVRRVQEMQSRARNATEHTRQTEQQAHSQRRPEFFTGQNRNGPPPPHREEPSTQKQAESHPLAPQQAEHEHPPAPAVKPKPSGGVNDIFEALLSDSERTLILLLILLLVGEGADMGLVLALMYLII